MTISAVTPAAGLVPDGNGRRTYSRLGEVQAMPNLIQVQLDSFEWFKREGLRELFEEISPISDFTGKSLELTFEDYSFGEPKHSEIECRERDMTYAAPLRVRVKLKSQQTGEVKEQEIFMGDFPIMTENGTFIINGAERVVVSQLVRSPGAYFKLEDDPTTGRKLCFTKLIPNRGAWLEFETSNKDVLSVKVDRKRKIPVSTLVRACWATLVRDDPEALRRAWKVLLHGDEAAIQSLDEAWERASALIAEKTGRDRNAAPFAPDLPDEDLIAMVEAARSRHLPDRERPTIRFAVGEGGSIHPIIEATPGETTAVQHDYMRETLARDTARTAKDALLEFYKRLRPGDPATDDNARSLVRSLFFNFRRYDLGRVGRHKLNKRLGFDAGVIGGYFRDAEGGGVSLTTAGSRPAGHLPQVPERTLTMADLIVIIRTMIDLNDGHGHSDDIDHLGNRRVRAVGELIQTQFRVGLLRMERVVKERMSITEADSATPASLINIRPVVAAIKEFFGGSQLSQFMDQTNPLAELTHKRRLSALGPGGLNRERAGMDVRDVHHSHYGRICPIETPEGPNIGLIGSLATYAVINPYGFIETPYRRVISHVDARVDALLGRTLGERVLDPATGEVIADRGTEIDRALAERLVATGRRQFRIRPYVSDDIVYLSADVEDELYIAQANSRLNERGEFADNQVEVRYKEEFAIVSPELVQYMDVSPKQIVSVATALIPFLEHDDANRALMGANMQRQAVPLLRPQSPLVGTGMERQAARDSGQIVLAREGGTVISATARRVVVREEDGTERHYPLLKFLRSNQGTCINQKPIVRVGDVVRRGDVLADSSSTQNGELALGQSVLVAFMVFEGWNFEDAIILSEDLVREDRFTSIHIEKHEVEARDTKLGPEEITRDIPNVGDEALRDLDENGIIRIGAEVKAGDILVGKITPKGETELTAEERLLRAIFGEKAREEKDTSLRVPHGQYGKVVDVKHFTREDHPELPPGVNELVRVSIAQKRKIQEGDKMAGRHGNKGVVSRILPREDMPYLPDGTPVDIILTPIGVPSRMNVGQILETHLGWAAEKLGIKVATPVFDGATEVDIEELLERAGLPKHGKIVLRDGRTGEPFDQEVTVGQIYMLKLIHLVEDKIHARSTGPYSLITQQPLGGKAQFGGQRFGEMEVWALEAYGAAHILQEILTVKSDDVVGRVKTYEAIVKGEDIMEPGVPESFKVLVKELQSLALAVEVLNEDEDRLTIVDETQAEEAPFDLADRLGPEFRD